MPPGPYYNKRIPANVSKLIASSTTTEIFTGTGVVIGVTIGTPVTDGTFHFTDTAGAAIAGLPNATDPWGVDSRGSYDFFDFHVTGGLKCVTTDADTVSMLVAAYTP